MDRFSLAELTLCGAYRFLEQAIAPGNCQAVGTAAGLLLLLTAEGGPLASTNSSPDR